MFASEPWLLGKDGTGKAKGSDTMKHLNARARVALMYGESTEGTATTKGIVQPSKNTRGAQSIA